MPRDGQEGSPCRHHPYGSSVQDLGCEPDLLPLSGKGPPRKRGHRRLIDQAGQGLL